MATSPMTPARVAGILARAYPHRRGIRRLIINYRPYSAPLEEIINRIPPGSDVLDVGCGAGELGVVALWVGRARRVVGFDTSERAIEIGRKAILPDGFELDLSVVSSGWPSGQFDVVLCVDVLHHVPRRRQRELCVNLCRSVKPGGRLIFKDMPPTPRWKALMNQLHDAIISREWVHHRAADEVARWLGDEGLTITESCRVDRLWYAHYLLVARKPRRRVSPL